MIETAEVVPAPQASSPVHDVPDDLCDAHSHVFGPPDRFVPAHAPAYALPNAHAEQHSKVRRKISAMRSVLIQPAPYGTNPAAILDAIAKRPHALRGVAAADLDENEDTLRSWVSAGIVGLRYSQMSRPGMGPYPGSVSFEVLQAMGPMLTSIGMQAHLWGKASDLVEWLPRLTKFRVPIVLDHMGVPDADAGANGAEFQELLSIIRQENVWVKLTACRVGKAIDNFASARGFHDAYLNAIPERLIWGSDWPYVRMSPAPDAGKMLDLFCAWTPDKSLRDDVLVSNPARLFEF